MGQRIVLQMPHRLVDSHIKDNSRNEVSRVAYYQSILTPEGSRGTTAKRGAISKLVYKIC